MYVAGEKDEAPLSRLSNLNGNIDEEQVLKKNKKKAPVEDDGDFFLMDHLKKPQKKDLKEVIIGHLRKTHPSK